MSLIAYVFPKLLTPKNVGTHMPKTSCLKTPFCNQCESAEVFTAAILSHFSSISDK